MDLHENESSLEVPEAGWLEIRADFPGDLRALVIELVV